MRAEPFTAEAPGGPAFPCRRIGEGPPLVLVPGLAQPAALFGTLPRTLARRGRTCLTYDPPGLGEAPERGRPWSFAEASADLAALLDAAGLERADLLGVSLGGKVALHFAAEQPDRVARLFLFGAEATGGPRARAVLALLGALFEALDGEALREAVVPLLFGAPFLAAKDPAYVRSLVPPAGARARHVARDQIRAAAALDPALLLPRVRAEVRLFAGGEDLLVRPSEVAETAARLPAATWRLIPEAGHSLLLEAPGPCLEALAPGGGRDSPPAGPPPTMPA